MYSLKAVTAFDAAGASGISGLRRDIGLSFEGLGPTDIRGCITAAKSILDPYSVDCFVLRGLQQVKSYLS